VDDIPKINSKGYLASTKWQPEAPTLYANGKAMFQGQCMACHTKGGYRSMKKLLGERDEEAIRGFLTVLHETDPDKNPYHGIMPPVVGNDEEIDALATYLSKLNVNTDEIELVKAH
jgi:mono/diheme cytochrome c family protein